MKRICVIGNSHVAAMRLAWEEMPQRPVDIDPIIVGQPQLRLAEAFFNERQIRFVSNHYMVWPRDCSLASRMVNPRQFDALAIVGCEFGPVQVMMAYQRMTFFGLAKSDVPAVPVDRFRNGLIRSLSATAAVHICRLWRSLTETPILILPNPFPSEAGFSDKQKPRMQLWKQCRESSDWQKLQPMLSAAIDTLQEQYGFIFVPQASDTMASACSTSHSYCAGSMRLQGQLDTPHPDDDYFHMNAQYGARMWTELAAALA